MSDTPGRLWSLCWRLAQGFWVGGLWGIYWVVLPVLQRVGLAPLLVDEVREALMPAMLALAAVCVLVQSLSLCLLQGLEALWRSGHGQLLLVAQLAIAAFFLLRLYWPEQLYPVYLSYLLAAACGLLQAFRTPPSVSVRSAR